MQDKTEETTSSSSEILSPESYLASLYEPDHELLNVQASLEERSLPQISVDPAYGRLLTLLIHISGAQTALEIGALGGYSGICLTRGLKHNVSKSDSTQSKLISLEIRQEFADLAMHNIQAAGYGDLVEFRVGAALDSLEQLEQEGCKFDFFFIDADKVNYPQYLEWAIKLANPGAIIVGDNLLMRGRTLDPNINKKSVEAMREFNRRFAADPRLESTMLPSFDGLAIARVK
jgi:caffeoyl-CoA O-methyltransferase